MDFNKLTRKSQEALAEAQGIAIGFNNQEVNVEHLLLALLRDGEGLIPRMLRRMDADPQVLDKLVTDEVARFPRSRAAGSRPGWRSPARFWEARWGPGPRSWLECLPSSSSAGASFRPTSLQRRAKSEP